MSNTKKSFSSLYNTGIVSVVLAYICVETHEDNFIKFNSDLEFLADTINAKAIEE